MAYLKQSFYPTTDSYIKDLKGHQDLKDLWFENRLKWMKEKDYEELIEAIDNEDFKKAKEILKK